jgi:acetyl esterase/lipase
MGFSAGGHVAATLAVHPGACTPSAADALDSFPTQPDFAVLAYPLISMAPPWGGARWRDNLLGTSFDPALAEYYSCQKHVTAETPPCFIVCTADDFTLRDSLAMAQALGEKKIPYELHVFEQGGHGYGMTKPGLDVTRFWPDLLHAWLQKRGVLAKD